jgi:hypothetical protein
MLILGSRLLKKGKFDLVYITTTQFVLFCLGRIWKLLFRVPYVLDFHDPWVRDGQRYVTTKQHWKSWLASALSSSLEKFAVNGAAGVVSVSPNYLEQLRARHAGQPSMRSERIAVIPFGAMLHDIRPRAGNDQITPVRRIVYVGAGGSIMANSFSRICQLLARLDAATRQRLRIDLYGTDSDWKPGMRKTLEEIANQHGLGRIVSEMPERISYGDAMRTIGAADGVFVLGVDDPAYMPSKLFLYALTKKPLLACLHSASQCNRYFEEIPMVGHLVQFGNARTERRDQKELTQFLDETLSQRNIDREVDLQPYLSPEAARRHAEFFMSCLPLTR